MNEIEDDSSWDVIEKDEFDKILDDAQDFSITEMELIAEIEKEL